MTDWIPVSERLPELTILEDKPVPSPNGMKPFPPVWRSNRVLVVTKDGHQALDYLVAKEDRTHARWWLHQHCTHWMPLPEPPK